MKNKVSKSELKARMLEYFRALEKSGGELIVTDYGKEVLKIVPIKRNQTVAEIFSDLRGKANISRDAAVEPTSDEWESEK